MLRRCLRRGSAHLRPEKVGTRYAARRRSARWSIRRTRKMSQQVHALQDAIKVSQKSAGTLRGAELGPGQPEESARCAAGARHDHARFQEGVRHQGPGRSGSASGRYGAAAWGGNPDKDATYLNVTPPKNDGNDRLQAQCQERAGQRLLVGQRLQRRGLFREERYDAYTLNNLTAKKSADGSIAIQFGGCDGKIPNCLPITKGWNYTVRLYRPRAEILNGKWTFPEPQPVQ